MVIFHGYVKLPEGMGKKIQKWWVSSPCRQILRPTPGMMQMTHHLSGLGVGSSGGQKLQPGYDCMNRIIDLGPMDIWDSLLYMYVITYVYI